MKHAKKILVTQSYLPPLTDYVSYLKTLWGTKWLTNNGALVQELEQKLADYLGVKHVLYLSNGTIAIQLALKALGITGEVITTPFTYVATTTSILWENCTPVFVDIDPKTYCLDPKKIEAAITPKTQAIMPVHVYGYPCDVEAIEHIAKKHHLRVIYDAAHAFGTKVNGRSVLSYGDVSSLSFHATKLFHTIEGGAVATNDDALAKKMAYYRSFGHVGDDYYMMGINAKNSEFHAAMGLTIFPKVPAIIKHRKALVELYDTILDGVLFRPEISKNVIYNYAYYPVLFTEESVLLKVKAALEAHNIIPRRYFYPSLNTLSYLGTSQSCPVSEDIARRVLCLPLFYDLKKSEVQKIAKLVRKNL